MSTREFTDAEAEILYRAWERRYRWHLAQVPAVVRRLREAVVPSPVPSTRDRVSGSGDDAPLPLRADPMVDADLLWSVLGEYVDEVASTLAVRPPAPLSGASAGNHTRNGFSGVLRPSEAATACGVVCRWLTDRVDVIYLLHLDDSEEFLFSMIRRMRARWLIPLSERTPRRQCTLCGEWRVTAQWVNTVSKPMLIVACGHCGNVYREPDIADLQGSSETSETVSPDDQVLARPGNAHDARPRPDGRRGDRAPDMAAQGAPREPDQATDTNEQQREVQ